MGFGNLFMVFQKQ